MGFSFNPEKAYWVTRAAGCLGVVVIVVVCSLAIASCTTVIFFR